MTTLTSPIQILDVPLKQLSAIRRKARRLGKTPEQYIKQLILDDLELDRVVKSKSLQEISAPIRKSLANTSEEEIGKLVENARRRHHRKLSRG